MLYDIKAKVRSRWQRGREREANLSTNQQMSDKKLQVQQVHDGEHQPPMTPLVQH